jgi:outer membrane lipoprotein-sorting protein
MIKQLWLVTIVIIVAYHLCDATSSVATLIKKKYTGSAHLTTQFEQNIYWSVREKTSKKRGTIILASNDNFRVELGNDLYISNGSLYWHYNSSSNQVDIRQLKNLDLSVQPSHMFKTFLTTYTFRETENNGKKATLVWKDDSAESTNYQSITLTVQLPSGIISSLVFIDSNDNIHTYTFKKTVFGKEVPTTTFEFEAPPNAHIIDNRR